MPNLKSHQAGFSAVAIAVVVLVAVVIGGIGFTVFKKSSDTKSAAVPAETSPNTSPTQNEQTATPVKEPLEDPYAGMTQYTNDKYGFSFYYPNEWRVEERDVKFTMDPEKTELSLWIVDKNAKSDPSTAVITIINRNLVEVTANLDGEITSHGAKLADYKTDITFKGKQAVKYTIKQPENVNRQRYYISVENKTYSLETIDERINIDRDASYMAKFNKVFDSLKVQ